MTIQIELSPETEAHLAAVAQARGIASEKYAGNLLREALAESKPVGWAGKVLLPDGRSHAQGGKTGARKMGPALRQTPK